MLSHYVEAQFGYLTGHVKDKFGPVYEAEISLENTPYGISTEIDGYFAFQLDTGKYVLVIVKPGYRPLRQNVIVNDFQTTKIDIVLESTILEQAVSSGSLSKESVRQMESSVPIDVIDGKDIMNTNQANLSAALHYLIPTLYGVDQTIADGTDFVSPVSMRGLSPDQLLVLVNGKRRHKSSLVHVNGTFGRGAAGTDLNTIPMASIDHIEVLRYGAAAQYGSDAISGVLNIVLKKGDEGVFFQGELGTTNEGDGQVMKIVGNYGFKIGPKGHMNIAMEFNQKEAINRSDSYTGMIYDDERDNNSSLRNEFFDQTGYDQKRVMSVGGAKTQNATLNFNGKLEIVEDVELYFFGGLNYRKGESTGFYRLPYDSAKVVHSLYPLGFSPEIHPTIFDRSFVIGERGKINNWFMDVSLNIGNNSFEYAIENSLNASMGINSPISTKAGGFDYGHKIVSVNLTRSLDTFVPLNISLGGEYRLENYGIRVGDESSYVNGGDSTVSGIHREIGFQVFTGFTPENEVAKIRSNMAGFIELKADVTPKLELIVAARIESYFNAYGPNISFKATGRYKFSDFAIVRGGYSTGFKAPSLHQLYYSRVSTQFVNGDAVRVANFNNESPVTQAFGISELSPELSRNYSVGMTSRPIRNFSTSLDYYRIDIDDRIVLTGQFKQSDDPIYEEILEPLGVESAQFFTNAVATTTSGIDYFLNYKFLKESNELNVALGYNYSKTEVTEVNASEILNEKKDILFGREEISRLESNIPLHKMILNISYSTEKLAFNVRNTYFGKVYYVHPDDGNSDNWLLNENSGQVESRDQEFSSKVITDVAVTYQLVSKVRLTVGANNLFNIYPDKQTHSANINEGRFVYSRRVQQFGMGGAYYFASMRFSL